MTVLGPAPGFRLLRSSRPPGTSGASSWQSTRRVLLPDAHARDRRRGAARLHPVDRRFRHHLLRRRAGVDDPAPPDLQHDQVRRAADDQRPVDPAPRRDLHGRRRRASVWPGRKDSPAGLDKGAFGRIPHERAAWIRSAAAVALARGGAPGSLLAAAGCGRPSPSSASTPGPTTSSPSSSGAFEREQGCRVVLDTFDSNEAMYAKLKAGAVGLRPPDADELHGQPDARPGDAPAARPRPAAQPRPRRPRLPEAIAVDRTMDHSVPYMLVITGIAYLEGRVKDFVPSWRMFGREDLRGRMTMFNDMRETIGAALKFLGYSINSTSDGGARRGRRRSSSSGRRTSPSSRTSSTRSGWPRASSCSSTPGTATSSRSAKENPDVRFFVPEEGTIISCDDLVIPARRP